MKKVLCIYCMHMVRICIHVSGKENRHVYVDMVRVHTHAHGLGHQACMHAYGYSGRHGREHVNIDTCT